MIRVLVVLAILVALGALKLPIERDLAALHRHEHFRGVEFNLDLREKLGQLGFIAALSGMGLVATERRSRDSMNSLRCQASASAVLPAS